MKVVFLFLTVLLGFTSFLVTVALIDLFDEGVFSGVVGLFMAALLWVFTWLSYRGSKGKYGIADLVDSGLDANTKVSGIDRSKAYFEDEIAYVDGSPVYRFDYFDAKGDYSQRRVKVNSIERKNGQLYINATDLDKHASRTFRVENIDSLVVEDTGEIIDDDDVNAHFSGVFA
ncbi:MAG: WYL domain-containing protein [Thiotrichales bacterium]|nr:WYL domain-containing protein [Thiotrichales bacterium]